jgi:hypothetical protein
MIRGQQNVKFIKFEHQIYSKVSRGTSNDIDWETPNHASSRLYRVLNWVGPRAGPAAVWGLQPLPRSSHAAHGRLLRWLSKPAPAVGSVKLSLFLALVFNLAVFSYLTIQCLVFNYVRLNLGTSQACRWVFFGVPRTLNTVLHTCPQLFFFDAALKWLRIQKCVLQSKPQENR